MNNLLFFFIFIPILSAIFLVLNIFLAPHNPDFQKVSQYECGFAPIPGQTRSTFQIHFMIVALLFLIFDLEILLLFPLAVSLYHSAKHLISFLAKQGLSFCLLTSK